MHINKKKYCSALIGAVALFCVILFIICGNSGGGINIVDTSREIFGIQDAYASSGSSSTTTPPANLSIDEESAFRNSTAIRMREKNGVATTLCKMLRMMQGRIGKAIAITVIISMGIGAFFGKLSFGAVITVSLGIGAMFGAERILSYFGPGVKGADGCRCKSSIMVNPHSRASGAFLGKRFINTGLKSAVGNDSSAGNCDDLSTGFDTADTTETTVTADQVGGKYLLTRDEQSGSYYYTTDRSNRKTGDLLVMSPSSQFSCPDGKIAVGTRCVPCDVGLYTTDRVSCQPCPENTYNNDIGQTACLSCLANSSSSAGSSSCSCNEGYSQGNTRAASIICTSCSAGTFADRKGMAACTPCAAGTYTSALRSTACTPCAAGTFAQNTGQRACAACPVNTYARTTGTVTCTACPTNSTTLSATGAERCTCSDGFMEIVNQTTNALESCGQCQAGSAAISGARTCTQCSVNTYSLAGARECTACPTNSSTLSLGGRPSCTCNAGYSQSGSGQSLLCTGCSAGSYNDIPGEQCKQCATGSFSSAANSSSCTMCQPGTFTATTGSTSCTSCPVGRFASLSGASSCANCQPGTFAAATGSTSCTLCQKGYFTSSVESTSCQPCAVNKYAGALGLSACTDCPANSTTVNNTGQEKCTCNAGYKEVNGPGGILQCQPCDAGTYSGAGSTQCTSCPINKFSSASASASCTDCPANSTTIGVLGASQCTCNAGYKQTVTDGVLSCEICASNTFSAVGQTSCTSCPVGSTSAQGSSTCICDANRYPSGSGATLVCSSCPAGKMLNAARNGCDNCLANTYSTIGSTSCTACPANSRSTEGSETCTCNKGYEKVLGADGGFSCTACVPGKYNPTDGGTCIDSPLGYFVSATAAFEATQCVPGKFADIAGLTLCKDCQTNTYSAAPAASVCTNCPANAVSNAQKIDCDCNGGYSKSVNAQNVISCNSCAEGTFSAAGSTSCTSCAVNTYSAASSSSCTQCPFSSTSPGGTGISGCMCPIGTNHTFSSNSLTCPDCTAGKYNDTIGSTCRDCSAGYSSATRASSCTACNAGTYSSSPGSPACAACADGQYTSVTASTSCRVCPTGGSVNAQKTSCACNAGNFATMTDGNVVSCTACPAGTVSTAGLTECTPCLAGTYSLTGDATCRACPANSSSAPGSSSCTCNSGYTASGSGITLSCTPSACTVPAATSVQLLLNGSAASGSVPHSTTLTTSCSSTAQKLSASSPSSVSCQFGAIDMTGVSCINKSGCTTPSVSNGVFTSTSIAHAGTTSFACNSGYDFVGATSSSFTCNDGSLANAQSVSASSVSCRRRCTVIPSITNGSVNKTSASEGESVTYSCSSGYTLVGSASVTCTNATISSTPTCFANCIARDDVCVWVNQEFAAGPASQRIKVCRSIVPSNHGNIFYSPTIEQNASTTNARGEVIKVKYRVRCDNGTTSFRMVIEWTPWWVNPQPDGSMNIDNTIPLQ